MRKLQMIVMSVAVIACGPESNSGSGGRGSGGAGDGGDQGDAGDDGAGDDDGGGEAGPGDGDVDGGGQDGPIELTGLWEDDFGGSFDIDKDGWGDQQMIEFDNTENVAIIQNLGGIEHFPSNFNKVVWTDVDDDGGFWVCTVGFGHETADLAKADEATGDATNPGEAGCGGFPWSRMSPGISVFGDWESNFGGLTHINRRWWGDARIERFNGNSAITQNRADDPWNPGKYNRVEWDTAEDGSFHFCTVAFGKDDAAGAVDDPAEADAADPSAGGCGGFPWTKLSAPIEVYGHFEDQFGFAMGITTGTWGNAGIVSFNATDNTAITQLPADSEFNSGKFSRIIWTAPDTNGEFWWCTEAFAQDSADAAAAAPAIADATDPENGGCGDFAWSKASPTLEVFGAWTDNFDGAWQIGDGKWGGWSVVSYTNSTNRAIVQYPEDDEFNPGKYSKVFWTDIGEDGTWAYCTANFGKDTAQAADEGPESADPSDLDGVGCGGFPWSRMAPTPLAQE